MPLREFPCRDTAVDLGSRTARVHVRGRGVVAEAPSLLAVCTRTGRFLAAGERALELHAGTPQEIRLCWPFEGGLAGEPEAAQCLLRHLLRHAHRRRFMAHPRMAVAVPSQLTDVQQNALAYAISGAGARSVTLVPVPLAAAMGAGLPVDEVRTSMVVDLGAVLTDIAVISTGAIVSARTVRVGGQDLDAAIVAYVRRTKNVLLGLDEAGEAKRKIGGRGGGHALVRGRDPHNGVPRPLVLTPADIAAATAEPLEEILEGIQATLERCPPEMVGDLLSNGTTLTGGGARLVGLTALVRGRIGLPVDVADDPLNAVVVGTAAHLNGTMTCPRRRSPPRRDRRHDFLVTARRF